MTVVYIIVGIFLVALPFAVVVVPRVVARVMAPRYSGDGSMRRSAFDLMDN